MGAHGYNQQQLGYSGKCRHPGWAPDGQSLVFESKGDIWRMTMRGTLLTRLTEAGDCHQPAWRPETNEVWYCRLRGGRERGYVASVSLWAVDATTKASRRVTDLNAGLVDGPGRTSWRPDGEMLAMDFATGGEGGAPDFVGADGAIAQVSLQTSNNRWGHWAFGCPAWSPGDQDLLATAELYRDDPHGSMKSEFAWSLVLLDTRKERETPVFDAPHPSPPAEIGMVSWPTWSPDGKRLAFTVWREWGGPTGPAMWLATPDGRYAHPIAQNAESPAWSPVRRT